MRAGLHCRAPVRKRRMVQAVLPMSDAGAYKKKAGNKDRAWNRQRRAETFAQFHNLTLSLRCMGYEG